MHFPPGFFDEPKVQMNSIYLNFFVTMESFLSILIDLMHPQTTKSKSKEYKTSHVSTTLFEKAMCRIII